MSAAPGNLYEPPGPRSVRRNRMLAAAATVVLIAVAVLVYVRFDANEQWAAEKWSPLIRPDVWSTFILPGLFGTLKAAVAGIFLATVFGFVFAAARMSEHRWLRVPAAVIVEFFRAVPLLLLIFFAFFGSFVLIGTSVSAFTAVVFGLTLYNGSVIAEIVRSGVHNLPKGQAEAAYALGMRKSQVMRLVLLPQAVRTMMPAIVSQCVVLLKDSALGFIVGYDELVDRGLNGIAANFSNVIPAAILIAVIFIAINVALDKFAHWLHENSGRRARQGDDAKPAAAEPQLVEAL
ncbi:amino acid ABC transporter permease [Streptosporangium sp. NBC_01756]|uniref:amino acid ABC transporter permease n=1 Tax=Streptosporangium sp. NBC_01756 TaxID=2975950 RepID=UPI002DD9E8C6|nr:amino acid ABC transporter permease [Streptosporangium sp. NBC_01756]WSC84731.1 amino acid ABC transporter permease [Streptosporangium sp. NBC_01756]